MVININCGTKVELSWEPSNSHAAQPIKFHNTSAQSSSRFANIKHSQNMMWNFFNIFENGHAVNPTAWCKLPASPKMEVVQFLKPNESKLGFWM